MKDEDEYDLSPVATTDVVGAENVTAPVILDVLRTSHDVQRGWLFVPELRFGTGFGRWVEQRLDAWAIQCWKKKGITQLRRAFEIKTSVSDLRQELRNPDKRWLAYAVSHEFYFVTPPGLLDTRLLTKDDGLIECTRSGMRVVKAPRVRESMPPRWDFVASLLRTVIR